MQLPTMDGWTILKELKNDSKTRHIPIKIISANTPDISTKNLGALDFIQKPISYDDLSKTIQSFITIGEKKTKDLLIIEDNEVLSKGLFELFNSEDLNIQIVNNAKSAISATKEKSYDCAIMDIGLPDMSGLKLLETIKKHNCDLPVVVYSGRDFTKDEYQILRKYSETIVLKTAESEKRLIEETTLFLHRAEQQLSPKQKNILKDTLDESLNSLIGKKILIVDDDIRNVFALTALIEDTVDTEISVAYNGQEALDILEKDNNFDIILMDIMMPVLDGYETIKQIRLNNKIKNIPILALTAKAQKDDRDKCIEAGANDYITKPVEHKQLLQLIKIWIKK